MEKKKFPLSTIITFLSDTNTKKITTMGIISRFFKYKKYLSNYSYFNEKQRSVSSFLIEFIYQFRHLNQLFLLTEKAKYRNLVTVRVRHVNITSESSILSSKYKFYHISFLIPGMMMCFEWNDIDYEVDVTWDKKRFTLQRDDKHEEIKKALLSCYTYFFDQLLKDFWDMDPREMNTRGFRVKDIYLSNISTFSDYSTSKEEYMKPHCSKSQHFYIDNNIYCICIPISGTVPIGLNSKVIFIKYKIDLFLEYESYLLQPLDVIVSLFISHRENQIQKKITQSLSKMIFCTNDLTL